MNTIQYGSAAYYLARWQEWQAKQQYTTEQKAKRLEKSRRSNAHQITKKIAARDETYTHIREGYPYYN